MTDKLYTPENCKMVGEWLAVAINAHPDFKAQNDRGLQYYFEEDKEAPELIREALAREGVLVDQWINPMVGNFIFLNKIGSGIIVRIPWNTDKSPTGRDELFAATVEYLEVK